jgi:beta-1,4-mannosyl-glycoprotein beta-1,4-N-acetylglucosaminyltransferase
VYSFEFFVDLESWRAKMVKYPADYTHSRSTDILLADAGWHCSFCFRYLNDFIFKMSGFSHADRIHSSSILDKTRIQKVICEGTDIFDMIPEVHSFQDLFAKWRPLTKHHSTLGLPQYLIEHASNYSFLLPGGCMREPDLA